MNARRVDWIDCAKGIAIVLVIIGHMVNNQMIRGVIFSFHMPLFFMLSSRTNKYSMDWRSYKRNVIRSFKHLIFPLLILWFISVVLLMITYIEKGIFIVEWREFIQERVLQLFWGSGSIFEYNGSTIYALGMPYFLFVLFIGRSIYDLFQMKYKGGLLFVFVCLLSMIGIIYGTTQWLPFSLDVALAVQPFFYVGDKTRNISLENNKCKYLIISLGVWFVILLYTCVILRRHYLEIAVREYSIYPLAIMAAIAGSVFTCEISIILKKFKPIYKQLCYLGQYSLYMFAIHHLHYSFSWLYSLTNNIYFNKILILLLHFVVFYIFMFWVNCLKNRKLRGKV